MLEAQLERGIAELGLNLPLSQQQQLIRFVNTLLRWNRSYNLTAIRDPALMVDRHLLDSLSVLPFLSGERLVDVGTGAGLPGVPLAIAAPERHFTLLDSNGKKTRFLVQVCAELGLSNIDVVHGRVEQVSVPEPFDAVLSRAFASLNAMIVGCHSLLAPQGRYLAMKGQYPRDELEVLDASVMLEAVHELFVPGVEEDRCLVVLRNQRN